MKWEWNFLTPKRPTKLFLKCWTSKKISLDICKTPVESLFFFRVTIEWKLIMKFANQSSSMRRLAAQKMSEEDPEYLIGQKNSLCSRVKGVHKHLVDCIIRAPQEQLRGPQVKPITSLRWFVRGMCELRWTQRSAPPFHDESVFFKTKNHYKIIHWWFWGWTDHQIHAHVLKER